MTTTKQTEANRRNAKRSTGPKSASGKNRASKNAIQHSVYAQELYPIDFGPLAESEAEFRDRAEQLIGGFDPQDALEAELAKRAVKALMAMSRLDRFEALLVNKESVLDPIATKMVGDLPEAESNLFNAEQLIRMVELDHENQLPTDAGFDAGEFEYWPENWEHIAPLVRSMCPKPKITVKDLWSEEATPSTPAGWASAVRTIWEHFWPEYDDRLMWARGVNSAMNIIYNDMKLKTESALASRIMNSALERVERPRTHAWKEFNQAMTQLGALRRLRSFDD